MFRLLVGVPATAYAFIAGLMVSVATSALTLIAFSEPEPPNHWQLVVSGVTTLLAGIVWFVLSEAAAAAERKVTTLAPAMGSRELAIAGVGKRAQASLILLFSIAAILTVLWPWAYNILRWAWNLVA